MTRRPSGLAAGPAFQRVCLELLGQAVQAGEADARQQAYLTDRVLLAEGNQQLYGTQFLDARPTPFRLLDELVHRFFGGPLVGRR